MEHLDHLVEWLEINKLPLRIGFYTGCVGSVIVAILLKGCI